MTPLRLALYEQDLLDPDDALEVRQRLAARRTPPRRVAPRQVAQRPRRSGWRIPPPGLGAQARFSAPSVMGSRTGVRSGDRFQIFLSDRPDAEQLVLVVLRRTGLGEWEVRSPPRPDRITHLSQRPLNEDGERRVDLLASGPAGPQRWAVALVPAPLKVDFSQPAPQRWADIQRRIARGEIAVSTVDIDVTDAS